MPANPVLIRIPRPSRRAKALAAAAATVLTTATFGAAHAEDVVFSDVPAGHPFAHDIYWLAETGVTTGYPDGTFRPDEPVTRQAMAAFLHRFHQLDDTLFVNHEVGGPFTTASEAWVQLPGAQVEFAIPEGMSGQLLATFSSESACSGATGFCRARVMVDDPATGAPGPVELGPDAGGFAFDSTDNGTEGTRSWESHSTQRVGSFGQPSDTWVAWVEVSTSEAGMASRLDDWVLSLLVDVQDSPILILE
jgi:hypothetical protein